MRQDWMHSWICLYSWCVPALRIQQRTARIALYAMAMEQLSVSEQFATLLHELRGEDVHHLDVEEDDIPQMAWIDAKSTAEDKPKTAVSL